jgi:ABC-type antimicrobial peptide transport system permease subunit
MLYSADPESAGRVADVALRGRGSPAALLPIFREELRRLDPEQWIWRLSTGSQALAEEEGQPRFLLVLMGVLACVAVTLAALGLYGVLAYSVTRRERELGIRTALGANRGRLRTMVLGEGLGMAATGVLLGGGGAVVASRALEHLLYEVEPGDPWTLLAAAALFFVVAGAASLLPALRATWVDPVEVLKAE